MIAPIDSPPIGLHGVLVDTVGVGILILGDSGIGKSECALELVIRGHRLVADDLIRIEKGKNGGLVGFSDDLGRHHMEVKGLGIIDIAKLFGKKAVRNRKRLELVIEFIAVEEDIGDHIGLSDDTYEILGVTVPRKRIPVRPGRNLAAIVEVAARDCLLKKRGYHAARKFEKELVMTLKAKD